MKNYKNQIDTINKKIDELHEVQSIIVVGGEVYKNSLIEEIRLEKEKAEVIKKHAATIRKGIIVAESTDGSVTIEIIKHKWDTLKSNDEIGEIINTEWNKLKESINNEKLESINKEIRETKRKMQQLLDSRDVLVSQISN